MDLIQNFPIPFPALLPLAIWMIAGPFYINFLKQKKAGQSIRKEGPSQHQEKKGTPTMGGLLLIFAIILSALAFALMLPFLQSLIFTSNTLILLLMGGILAALGFYDDWLKVIEKKNDGISGYLKLSVQLILGWLLGIWMIYSKNHMSIDIFHFFTLNLDFMYPFFTALIVAGFSNAYNLTDGLDGLAGACGIVSFLGLSFILITAAPDLSFMSMLIFGSLTGFLVFNKHPAKIFMGDTGSLPLGGLLATICILAKVELAVFIFGLIYAIEALSVILQVASFKLRQKRIFKMSPIHHHFELSGWSEPQIVLAFTLLQASIGVLGFFLYNKL